MKILVTGGPTREYMDRVRFISNPSTGLMGDALALEATARGHKVVLVRGPCPGPGPSGIETVSIETTDEMRRACLERWPACDAVIMSAAPCDYGPRERHPGKMKKLAIGEKVILTLVRTPDILAEMGDRKAAHQKLVGFAVEVEDGEQNARGKLERKNLDLVVLNPPENFGRDGGSHCIVLGRAGRVAELSGNKRELARGILDALEGLCATDGAGGGKKSSEVEGEIMRNTIGLIMAAALVAVAGCNEPAPAPEQPKLNLTVLSTALIQRYQITAEEFVKLQYYLDKEFVITRKLGTGERNVAHGKIEIRNGMQVNEVVVEPLTQGVALRRESDGRGLNVGFDPASQAAFAFGPGPTGEYELGIDAQGRVVYDGAAYTLQTRGNRLLVDLTAVSQVVKTRKTLPGRTIDEPK